MDSSAAAVAAAAAATAAAAAVDMDLDDALWSDLIIDDPAILHAANLNLWSFSPQPPPPPQQNPSGRDPVVPPDSLFTEDEHPMRLHLQQPALLLDTLQYAPPPPPPAPAPPVDVPRRPTVEHKLDLNDAFTLHLYDKLLLWRHNCPSQPELVFESCPAHQDAVLRQLALRFGLIYRFDASLHRATLSRQPTYNDLATVNLDPPALVTMNMIPPSSIIDQSPLSRHDSFTSRSDSASAFALSFGLEPALTSTTTPTTLDWGSRSSLALTCSSSGGGGGGISSPSEFAVSPRDMRSNSMLGPSHSKPSASGSATTHKLGDSISRMSSWRIFAPGKALGGISRGRSGAVSAYNREKSKALEAVGGACWRCKVIRRRCDPGSPCKSCPALQLGEDAPLWPVIGCRRGSLGDAMPRQSLCPKSRRPPSRSSRLSPSPPLSSSTTKHNNSKNSQKQHSCSTNTNNLPPLPLPNNNNDNTHLHLAAQCLGDAEKLRLQDSEEILSNSPVLSLAERGSSNAAAAFASIVRSGTLRDSISLNKPCRIRDKSLTCADLITGIAWELADNKDLMSMLDIESADKFIELLQTACTYEEEVTKASSSLVIFSVICLRYCLEVLRLHNAGVIGDSAHHSCNADQCSITSIRVLCSYLAAYVDELSLVMFKKENLRDRRWWLSTFYSLCIQSHVRHALMILEKELLFPETATTNTITTTAVAGAAATGPSNITTTTTTTNNNNSNDQHYSAKYLHLATMLFTAASAQYDPLLGGRLQYALTDDSVVPETSVPELHHLSARMVFEVDSWPDRGIKTSYHHLRKVFQIDSLDFENEDQLMLMMDWDASHNPDPQQQQHAVASAASASAQASASSLSTQASHSSSSLGRTSRSSLGSSLGEGQRLSLGSADNALGICVVGSNQAPLAVSLDQHQQSEVVVEGALACVCCPKRPRYFHTFEELIAHQDEKPHMCTTCPSRFKSAAEAERHANAVHRRGDSWCCGRLGDDVGAAFHALVAGPDSATYDICGFCGRGFKRGPGTEPGELADHVRAGHGFGRGGCNWDKRFYRADHFRQHLRASHAAVPGKWLRFLERSCRLRE